MWIAPEWSCEDGLDEDIHHPSSIISDQPQPGSSSSLRTSETAVTCNFWWVTCSRILDDTRETAATCDTSPFNWPTEAYTESYALIDANSKLMRWVKSSESWIKISDNSQVRPDDPSWFNGAQRRSKTKLKRSTLYNLNTITQVRLQAAYRRSHGCFLVRGGLGQYTCWHAR